MPTPAGAGTIDSRVRARRPDAPDRESVEPALKVVRKRTRRRVSPPRVFLEATQRDRLRVARQSGHERPGQGGFTASHQIERLDHRRGLERRSSGQEAVKGGPEGKDVRSRTDGGAVAGDLFRCHERGGTSHSVWAGRRRARVVARPGDAEVGDHRHHLIPGTIARAVEQDVRGLDVEMQHPGAMDLVDGPSDRRHQLDRRPRRQRAGDAVRQATPGDQVEDEVETAVLLARLVEPDDVGMADPPDRPGLAKPAPAILGTDQGGRADDLDGDAAGQLRLPRLIDDRHSPPPEHALDLESGDRGRVLQLRRSSGDSFPADGRISGVAFQDILTICAHLDMSFHGREVRTARRIAREPAERLGRGAWGHGKPHRRSEGSINLRPVRLPDHAPTVRSGAVAPALGASAAPASGPRRRRNK